MYFFKSGLVFTILMIKLFKCKLLLTLLYINVKQKKSIVKLDEFWKLGKKEMVVLRAGIRVVVKL